MKVKFTPTDGFKVYHDSPDWKGECVRQVSDEKGKYLIETFSKNFSEVTEEKMVKKAKNKMAKGKNK